MLKIPEITTPNNQWLQTTITKHIKDKIQQFFESDEWFNELESMWFKMIEETNPKLYKKLQDLHDNPPCLGSDLWYYEEELGKPPGFEIFIYSIIQAMDFEKKCPDWNNGKEKHLEKYWTNPYNINYHEKTTYTKKELTEHYKNYDANQQDVLDQINTLPITQELQLSLKETLIQTGLWEKPLNTPKMINQYNEISKGFNQEIIRNICFDTIQQPRNVRTPIPKYDDDFYTIYLP